MKSIYFSYDAEGDILEASFAPEEPGRRTGIELNDNIVVFADSTLSKATGVTLLSYSRLLLLPQITLNALPSLSEDKLDKLFVLLQAPPLANFLQTIDRARLLCKVLNPNVQELVEIGPR